jgi:hypothetical protein
MKRDMIHDRCQRTFSDSRSSYSQTSMPSCNDIKKKKKIELQYYMDSDIRVCAINPVIYLKSRFEDF